MKKYKKLHFYSFLTERLDFNLILENQIEQADEIHGNLKMIAAARYFKPYASNIRA